MTQSQKYPQHFRPCIWWVRERKRTNENNFAILSVDITVTWCWMLHDVNGSDNDNDDYDYDIWQIYTHTQNTKTISHIHIAFIFLVLFRIFYLSLSRRNFKRKQKHFSNPLFSTQTMHRSRSHALKKHFGFDGNFRCGTKTYGTSYTTKCEFMYKCWLEARFLWKWFFPFASHHNKHAYMLCVMRYFSVCRLILSLMSSVCVSRYIVSQALPCSHNQINFPAYK